MLELSHVPRPKPFIIEKDGIIIKTWLHHDTSLGAIWRELSSGYHGGRGKALKVQGSLKVGQRKRLHADKWVLLNFIPKHKNNGLLTLDPYFSKLDSLICCCIVIFSFAVMDIEKTQRGEEDRKGSEKERQRQREQIVGRGREIIWVLNIGRTEGSFKNFIFFFENFINVYCDTMCFGHIDSLLPPLVTHESPMSWLLITAFFILL